MFFYLDFVCYIKRNESHSNTISPFLCLQQPIHDLLIRSVADADIDGAIIALKVLGNAGHPASLKPIMKILPGFSTAAAALPLNVHIEAILALRNIAKKEPKLVGLYHNS